MAHKDITISTGDIPLSIYESFSLSDILAVDTETSGLDWNTNSVQTIQIYNPNDGMAVLVKLDKRPRLIISLLENTSINKIFHHAMFDLRFLINEWEFSPMNISCTKIASKILHPSKTRHSLKNLAAEYLNVDLDKSLQASDWSSDNLTQEQHEYAIRDTLVLPPIFEIQKDELVRIGKWQIASQCFEFIPCQVRLELMDVNNVFAY